MTKSIIRLAIAVLLTAPLSLWGQVVVGDNTPDPSAILDVQGTDKGFLFTRLNTAGRDAIASPARGLIIFNTGTFCLEINQGSPTAPRWERVKCRTGAVSGLDCGNASAAGSEVIIPYTGGNGGVYASQIASSTGVTGLEATLPAGNYAVGGGNLSWTVTGVPSSYGSANFSLTSGGFTCSFPFIVAAGTITGLNCAGAVVTGALFSGQAASGVSASVPYTGGNGGLYIGQAVTSTGVTGLTATLIAGSFSVGSGALTCSITGTPSSGGTASFAISIGGQSCNLDVNVLSGPFCPAKVNATDYKNFMCYNLGAANTNADPFTPSWEINGGYWQWGRTAEAAAGPTGPGAGETSGAAIAGWITSHAASGSWADGSKTANDPCPTGYRVPTKAQWEGVLAHNTKTNVGTFSGSATNYSAGKKFGNDLMLPVVGYRYYDNGELGNRGNNGYYWSSTENGTTNAWYLFFSMSDAFPFYLGRPYGLSVRCIAE